MASLPQSSLFRWQEIEDLRDLERLRLVLGYLPDEPLMRRLEADRGRGRDDYPVRAVWNSLLAGIVFQHPSVESLRRELQRNASLRQACGCDPLEGMDAVPTAWAYTHFLQSLLAHADRVDAIFDDLVERLRTELPDFGRLLAIDGKALRTHARPRRKDAPLPPAAATPTPTSAGRRNTASTTTARRGRRSRSGSGTACTWWWTPNTNSRWRMR